MSWNTIIPNTPKIDKFFHRLNLPLYFSKPVINHIKSFFRASFTKGFSAKTIDIALKSNRHRTSVGHFLSRGNWDESRIDTKIKYHSLKYSLKTSRSTHKPIFIIHDDTICKKSKPSSQAKAPMQDCAYHFSHLEGKSVWGHQLLSTMIQCNDHTLIYDIHPYKKNGKSKIDLVCELTSSLPIPPNKGYALFDTWFTSAKVIHTYASKGYHCIGGLKTNRIIYPSGIRISIKDFAKYIKKTDVNLVTVNSSEYYVYRYEGPINDVENTIVLLSWPVESFGDSKAMKAFLCTDVSLNTATILQYYCKRWPIETFFKQQKGYLGLNKYQVRSSKAIKRIWILQALVHLFCTISSERPLKFSDAIKYFRKEEHISIITIIYEFGKNSVPLEDVLKLLKVA